MLGETRLEAPRIPGTWIPTAHHPSAVDDPPAEVGLGDDPPREAWSIAEPDGARRPAEPIDLSVFDAHPRSEESAIPEAFRDSSAASNAYVMTNAIDAQIADVTRQLRSVHDDSARILARKSLLDGIAAAAHDAGKNGDKEFDLAELRIPAADGSMISAKVALERAGLLDIVDPDGDGHATVNSLQSIVESLDSALSAVNTRTQLQMLQLQELTHQRGLFLQLATNDLAAREQIERRIAENIR